MVVSGEPRALTSVDGEHWNSIGEGKFWFELGDLEFPKIGTKSFLIGVFRMEKPASLNRVSLASPLRVDDADIEAREHKMKT